MKNVANDYEAKCTTLSFSTSACFDAKHRLALQFTEVADFLNKCYFQTEVFLNQQWRDQKKIGLDSIHNLQWTRDAELQISEKNHTSNGCDSLTAALLHRNTQSTALGGLPSAQPAWWMPEHLPTPSPFLLTGACSTSRSTAQPQQQLAVRCDAPSYLGAVPTRAAGCTHRAPCSSLAHF